jgi:pimeloyl-ACP methyl ester carboxylesterase
MAIGAVCKVPSRTVTASPVRWTRSPCSTVRTRPVRAEACRPVRRSRPRRADQLPLATEGYRCIGLDRRGHGKSEDVWGGFDLDTLADDLGSLLDHLDLRDVTLIGHSLGSNEAVRYLTRHGSGRVARLALVAGMAPGIVRGDDNPEGLPAEAIAAANETFRRDRAEFFRDRRRCLLRPRPARQRRLGRVRPEGDPGLSRRHRPGRDRARGQLGDPGYGPRGSEDRHPHAGDPRRPGRLRPHRPHRPPRRRPHPRQHLQAVRERGPRPVRDARRATQRGSAGVQTQALSGR